MHSLWDGLSGLWLGLGSHSFNWIIAYNQQFCDFFQFIKSSTFQVFCALDYSWLNYILTGWSSMSSTSPWRLIDSWDTGSMQLCPKTQRERNGEQHEVLWYYSVFHFFALSPVEAVISDPLYVFRDVVSNCMYWFSYLSFSPALSRSMLLSFTTYCQVFNFFFFFLAMS